MTRALEALVLQKLAAGPMYAKSFRHVKPVVLRLIASGKVQRVAPPGLLKRNMIALTPDN